MTLKQAIYLVRPYSLPASVSPVLVGITYYLTEQSVFSLRAVWASILCLFVALLGQCFCNVINDVADYESGVDLNGRSGFDRIVASGKVSLKTAKKASWILAIVTAILGLLTIIVSGNLWLLLLGVFVLLGAYAYSAGPFPFAYHALGELAVFVFYGLVATMGTYYVATGQITLKIILLGMAMGLASVNILLVNNYRDVVEDREANKKTIAVIFGAELLPKLYSSNTLLILFCLIPFYNWLTLFLIIPFFLYEIRLSRRMMMLKGGALNKILSATAKGVLLLAITIIVFLLVNRFIVLPSLIV